MRNRNRMLIVDQTWALTKRAKMRTFHESPKPCDAQELLKAAQNFHAAWDKLSEDEKERLTTYLMLQIAYP